MRVARALIPLLSLFVFAHASHAAKEPKANVYTAGRTADAVRIDGILDETDWGKVPWEPVTHLWEGKLPVSEKDFTGRFKLLWNGEQSRLFVAFEATDDKFSDLTPDPLIDWWTDDCVEVFVDPDNSGGIHQYNHSAFAFHVNMAGEAVDLDEDASPFKAGIRDVESVSRPDGQRGGVRIWEIAVTLYSGYSTRDPSGNRRQAVKAGDSVGFSIAYCDNDGRKGVRESFIGWVDLPAARRNDSWIDAGVFGTVLLGE